MMEEPGAREPRGDGIDFDGLGDHRSESSSNPFEFGVAEPADASVGGDLRLVEDFVGDPVAHSGGEGLVEQDTLDRPRESRGRRRRNEARRGSIGDPTLVVELSPTDARTARS